MAPFTACATIGCAMLAAQTPPAKPQFEVASVKLAARPIPPMLRQMRREGVATGSIPMDDPVRVSLVDYAVLDLIAAAYQVRAAQVVGPSWISGQGFDIEAKVPEGTPKAQLNVMLRSLLEDRFGLRAHRGTETRQGFALAIGKDGPKLKPAENALTSEQREQRSASDKGRMEQMRQQGTPLTGLSRLTLRSTTTEQLATQLARFTEAPVVDETGLTGKYSVVIETWKNSDVPGGTIFDAVQSLGLRLEPRKLRVETVVVDEVAKMPTAN